MAKRGGLAAVTPVGPSLFSYSLSRPYPYRWLTPVVFIGGIVALVLFSLLNYVSNGFQQTVQYVTDPNKTISDHQWVNKWPSYFTGQIKPSCQPLGININTEIFTNQTGLIYTLTNVWQRPGNGTIGAPSSSLTYLNNPIQNCVINSIQVDLESEDRSGSQYAFAIWGQNVLAFITCDIESDSGLLSFNLTSSYDFVPPTAGMPTSRNYAPNQTFSFLSTDPHAKASLWWGESLMSMYWANVSRQMQDIRSDGHTNDSVLRKGTMYFKRHNPADPVQDITDHHFWDVDFRFLTNEVFSDGLIFSCESAKKNSISDLAAQECRPNVWLSTDGLVKSFYSTIMTDLGQTAPGPNTLLNETALEFYTRNFTDMFTHIANAIPGPGIQSYADGKDQTGSLGTTSSVIFTKYLCQVPQQKSTGTLLVSILVADLVFMQLLWKVFNFITTAVLIRKNPKANYCEGCASRGSYSLIDMAALPGRLTLGVEDPVDADGRLLDTERTSMGPSLGER